MRIQWWLTLVAVVFLSFPVSAGEFEFRVDHVDADGFIKAGEVRFYVDLLDENQKVIGEFSEDELEIFLDGEKEPIEGSISAETFKDTQEGVAVAIVMSMHNAYVAAPGEGQDKSSFAYQKEGVLRFLDELGEVDWVGVYAYDEDGLQVVSNFANGTRSAKAAVKKMKSGNESPILKNPKLFKCLKDVIEDKLGDEDLELPRRKVLIIMSDGLNKASSNKKHESALGRTADAAQEPGVKVYSIAYSSGDTSYFKYLDQLSTETRGVYREISWEDRQQVAEVYESLAKELNEQFVVTLKTEELDGGKKQVFRLVVDVRGNELTAKSEGVDLKDKGFDWWGFFKIILIVVCSLLVIFLLVKLIRGWARRRAEAANQEPEEYTGPSKGRLVVTGGPYAGIEFYLTSETVTIGSMDKNDISLEGDDACSKRHAGIKIDGMRYELADFGSTNGTYVNGRRVNKVFLKDGDQVRVGSSEMTFRMN